MTETLTIIGSGPGGYVAAVLASKEGLDVRVVEKDVIGGTCTNRGCIPSKALLSTAEKIDSIKNSRREGIKAKLEDIDFEKVMAKKDRAVKMSRKAIKNLFDENDIELIEGEAKIVDEKSVEVDGEIIESDHIIIATGSKPASLPGIKLDGEKIISSKEALELEAIPESMLIVGGGYIGLEMASVYSSMGSDIHIVELEDRLIPNMDKDLSQVAEKMMKRKRIKMYTGSKVKEITESEKLEVKLEGESEKSLEVEKVLMSVGRRPTPPENELDLTDEKGFIEVDSKMRTDYEEIYAIGDVTGKSMLAHSAFKQAEIAVEDIVESQGKDFDSTYIPAGIYTHPEIASVGLSEEEAEEKLDEVKIGKFPISATGRGSSTGERMGLAKVIADSENRIRGLHLVCPGATDIIMEGTLALQKEMKVQEIGDLIHPHPTYSEAIKEAAENVTGESVHS